MFTLPAKRDGFRLLLPKEIIPREIEEKYTKILVDAKSFITKPIDFLNESIQKVQVLGFQTATIEQQQTDRPSLLRTPGREFSTQGGSSGYQYRSPGSPLSLIDKTINIDFRHTLGYVNYFLMFESFWYMYSRDTNYLNDLEYNFCIDLFNEKGSIYSRVVLNHPLLDGMDMLDFDFTQPLAASSTFRCIFKYNDIDYQFMNIDNITYTETEVPYGEDIEESKRTKKKGDESYLNYPYSSISIEDGSFGNMSQNPRQKYVDTSKTLVDENGNPIKMHDR